MKTFTFQLRSKPVERTYGDGLANLRPLSSDIPLALSVSVCQAPESGLQLRIAYAGGTEEPTERRVVNTVRFEIGTFSGRVLAVQIPTRGISRDRLHEIAEALNEALKKLEADADRPGRKLHYRVARESLELRDATPPWMVQALASLRSDSRPHR